MATFGSARSQRANIDLCWFPPERVFINASIVGIRTAVVFVAYSAMRRSAAGRNSEDLASGGGG